nr:MAG TPA: hypothetical protein [Caudoviricetes sp.]
MPAERDHKSASFLMRHSLRPSPLCLGCRVCHASRNEV